MLNNCSKFNAISPGYTEKLNLKIEKTNVKAHKIDNSILEIFKIVITNFQMKNKINRLKFF